MKWQEVLNIVGAEPVFSSSLFRLGCEAEAVDFGRQLTRWVSAGRLLQLRRGLYALAPPFRKTTLHPFLLANRLRRGSYVSLQTALELHSLIPEHTPNITSVTTSRTETVSTPLGTFIFRHIHKKFFFGTEDMDLGDGQRAWIATPEKALLDLVHLTPHIPSAEEEAFWAELRLQNLGVLDAGRLREMGKRMDGPKIRKAIRWINSYMEAEKEIVP